MLRALSTIALGLCLTGFAYPQPGVNVPEAPSAAHDYIMANPCTAARPTECFLVSTSTTAETGGFAGVILYRYSSWQRVVGVNFVARYAHALADDCYQQSRQDACHYLAQQIGWIDAYRESPHKGLDIWRYGNGYADGYSQGEVAWLYEKMAGYTGAPSYYLPLAERAGKAFDWAWGNSGVAHAYSDFYYFFMHVLNGSPTPHFVLNTHGLAIRRLHNLCENHKNDEYGAAWCTRRNRGVNVLKAKSTTRVDVSDFNCASGCGSYPNNWTYYKVRADGSGMNLASCGYHELSTNRVKAIDVDYGLDPSGTLRYYWTRWEAALDEARARGLCPSALTADAD